MAIEMSQTISQNRLPMGRSMTHRMCVLVAALLLAGLIVFGIGVWLLGGSVAVCLIAWAICTVSAIAAHIGSEFPRGEYNFAARLAIQMLVRTIPPFALAIWGTKFANPPLETSLVFYILAFYLTGLMTDIQLQLGRLKVQQSDSQVNG